MADQYQGASPISSLLHHLIALFIQQCIALKYLEHHYHLVNDCKWPCRKCLKNYHFRTLDEKMSLSIQPPFVYFSPGHQQQNYFQHLPKTCQSQQSLEALKKWESSVFPQFPSWWTLRVKSVESTSYKERNERSSNLCILVPLRL